MYTRYLLRLLASSAALALLPSAVLAQQRPAAPVLLEKPSIVYKVQSASERLEMTAHSSRILTMDQKIPRPKSTIPTCWS